MIKIAEMNQRYGFVTRARVSKRASERLSGKCGVSGRGHQNNDKYFSFFSLFHLGRNSI